MTRPTVQPGCPPLRRAFVLTFIAIVGFVACGPGHGAFDDHTMHELTTAIGQGRLEVCSTSSHSNGFANQATSTRILFLAIDCHDEVVTLIVDRFRNRDDRDAAARNFESQQRPLADGVVWTWGPFTIEAVGARDDAIMNRLTQVLDRIGAQ